MAAKVTWDGSATITENLLYALTFAKAMGEGRIPPRTLTEAKTLYKDVFTPFNDDDFAAVDAIIGSKAGGDLAGAHKLPNIAAITTGNAVDLTTTEALANALKTNFNLLLERLGESNLMLGI